ncbi:GrpB family protein [Winogradskya consettensis]|uniref:GrpB family protein n=1 Tax=Winogradskya consettensis TaxID=113560 RepID=A0A919VPY7_9ACTN|nr:GrpB family protein [Actinoplanes consettensis]GIM71891.1 hypothetical protein Aco04nite_27580 [Actinoplanes consettensis]
MTLAEPDPRWDALARTAIKALEDYFDEVEHIGATAVPGMPASATIDLLAAIEDLDEVDDGALRRLAYRLAVPPVDDMLLYRRENYDSLGYCLYVVPTASWPERPERLLRDYLTTHPAERERYAARKTELMDRFGPGEAYTRGKAALMQEMSDAERAGRGLPPIPVWEE